MDEVEAGVEGDHERTESYVVFQIGGESYALEVARVREVLDVGLLTRVPGASRSLSGLCNLRGQVVPIWNLRVLFQMSEERSQDRPPSVLMVESETDQAARLAGLLVDQVSDVLDFLPEDIQPAPALGLEGISTFVRGLIRDQDRFLLVMDLDRVLAALRQETVPESRQ